MATYAIGDVQGCFDPLQALLGRIRFDESRDHLWFTGDLVNRGPRSADVLRFVMRLGERAVSVLGNHDLHLLAVASGARRARAEDRLDEILHAADRDQLLAWLRQRPLLHHDPDLGFTLIHAGLVPQWDLATAQGLAAEVEQVLRGRHYVELCRQMYGDMPDVWAPALTGWPRMRLVVNAFTRMRYCDARGRIRLKPVGPPGSQPGGLLPWFQVPGRHSRGLQIVFGHWSSLGAWHGDGVIALDTGCCWGRALTAVALDPPAPRFFSVSCQN
jgi:bis(5'-nucleosyl)-tetraphosphatase (symmetrical)